KDFISRYWTPWVIDDKIVATDAPRPVTPWLTSIAGFLPIRWVIAASTSAVLAFTIIHTAPTVQFAAGAITRYFVGGPSTPKINSFTYNNISRSGTMLDIRVTIIDNSTTKQPNKFTIEYKWTGSGGTQGGTQTATLLFKGANDTTLDKVTFPIDRSH